MPFEGDCANPLHGHDSNRRSEQKSEQGKDPEIHDQGLTEYREIGYILEHNSRPDRNSSLHRRVNQAGIIIGARMVEPLAERLACTKEVGGG
jgi:hypothetical protein